MINLPNPLPRLKFVEDLAKVKPSTTELNIHGYVKNIELLPALTNLHKVYICTVTQQQFNAILSLVNPPELKLYEVRVADLSRLSSLTRLEKLELDWNTKATGLWDMRPNTRLRSLSVNDFSKLDNVDEIRNAPQLEKLNLSGGMWNKLKLQSLEPLRALDSLRLLCLGNLSIEKGGLDPLATLRQLEELDISNQFPNSEYAKLSVALPNTKCRYFQPYVEAKGIFPDKDTMVTGTRKPFLHSERDAERLAKYATEFKKLQDQFRSQL